MGATLDMGGWLALTQQGLAPCKMHQASLGALTSQITGGKKQSEERAALFAVRVHLHCYAFIAFMSAPKYSARPVLNKPYQASNTGGS